VSDLWTVDFDGGKVTLRYALIYAERSPRWWWCKWLPKTWEWAWRGRPIAYVDLTNAQS
jgi:hypothetical protein